MMQKYKPDNAFCKTHFAIMAAILLLFCAACGESSQALPASQQNPMGLAGKFPPEAEKNFALARVLWTDKKDICSDPEKAIEYLDKTIALAPDYAEAYVRRGMAKSDLQDWQGAFDDITAGIRINNRPDYYAYRGLVSLRGGNLLGARKDLDRSTDLNSSQYRAWNYKGELFILEENYPEACKNFKKGCANGDCSALEAAREDKYCD